MGNCINKPSRKYPKKRVHAEVLCVYPRSGSVTIRYKNYLGKVTNEQKLTFDVTDPKSVTSSIESINESKFLFSLCILPGLDIRNPGTKVCQDDALYISDGNSLFIALFDGHGIEGEKVADFCKSTAASLYNTKKEIRKRDPYEFMSLITESCDKELEKKPNGITATFSGTTAVFIYMTENKIYSGSVGDSRAILGTTQKPSNLNVPNSVLADKEILEEVRDRRSSNPETKIYPLQLTKDQKPNDVEERKRIQNSGGRVQRLIDEFGKRIGPYRVWDKNGNYPGLAMSRSIGDLMAKRIGVISEPVCFEHQFSKDADLFIIIASDGLWDVMDNEDVANFVECFRRKCRTDIVKENRCEVNISNSCIAQLLAEEARLRWYSIVEEEDVIIDDITCVVVEIQVSGHTLVQHQKRPVPLEISLPIDGVDGIPDIGFVRAPTIKEVAIRDPKRGSVVNENLFKVDID